MKLVRCPFCNGKHRGKLVRLWLGFYDADDQVTIALSRRDNDTDICTLCAKAEALADMSGAMDDTMARIAVGQFHQEALRLPAGGRYSMFGFPTGGLDEYLDRWAQVYEPKELAHAP